MSSTLDEPDFVRLIDDNYAAWSTRDLAKVAPFYATEPTLIFFDLGNRCDGWDSYRSLAQHALDTMERFDLKRTCEPAIIRGTGVVVTADEYQVHATSKAGQTDRYAGFHTAVWREHGGRWLIVHEHQSKRGE